MAARTLLALTTALAIGACEENGDEPREGEANEPPEEKAEESPEGKTDSTRAGGDIAEVDVEVFGSIHEVMMEDDTAVKVRLGELDPGESLYGLGALSELRGEITVAGGKACLAYPEGDADVVVQRTREPSEEAALFVAAEVDAWKEISLDETAAAGGLDSAIESAARAEGWSGDGALPFILEGPVRELSYHVIDGTRVPSGGGHEAHRQASVQGQIEDERVTVVGFYSAEHRGVFTHRDADTHMHFDQGEAGPCGHVDAIEPADGITLKLPVQGSAS